MKRALALILALVMTMALVACGGNKTTTSTPSTSTPATSTPSTTEPSKPAETPTTPTEPAKPAEPKILHLTSKTAAASGLSLVSTSEADSELQGYIQGKLYGYLPIDGKSALSPLLAAELPIDVNGDGYLNIADVNDILCCLSGAVDISDFAYDIDENGILNINDLNELLIALSKIA